MEEGLSVYSQQAASASADPEQQLQSLLEPEYQCILFPCNILGFSIAGCEFGPGPVFDYARIWSHMNAVQHVAEAFSALTRRQIARQTVRGQPWSDELENLGGSPEELSRYISLEEHVKNGSDLSVHGSSSQQLFLNSIFAAFVTIFLQWSSTGAAIVIAYK